MSQCAETVAFSRDGTLVATGGPDRACRLWTVPDGDLLATFEGHIGGVTAIAFTPDGQYLVTGSDDTTALVWDVRGAIEDR